MCKNCGQMINSEGKLVDLCPSPDCDPDPDKCKCLD